MPVPRTPVVAHLRASVARLSQIHRPGDPALDDARRALRLAMATEYIQDMLGAVPPLSDDQKADLIRLFGTARRGGVSP